MTKRQAMSGNLRREGRVEARIQVLVVRGRQTVTLESSDVSFKGLFLRMEDPPPVRSLMRLRIMLPGRVIEAHAMAVHVTTPADVVESERVPTSSSSAGGAGVGVQFWGLAGPDRTAWDDFVRELIHTKRTAEKRPSGKMAVAAAQSGTQIASAREPKRASSNKK